MAPPTFTGYTQILNIQTLSGAQITTDSTYGSVTFQSNQGRVRISGITNVGVNGYLEIDLDAPTNLSQSVVIFGVEHNFDGDSLLRLGFSSGVTPDLNYRVWDISPELRLNRYQIVLDPGLATGATDTGTFVPTDVRRIRLEFFDASNKQFQIYSSPLVAPKSTGLIGVGGDGVTPLTLASFVEFLTEGYYGILATGSSDVYSMEFSPVRELGNYVDMPVPITLGDGGVTPTLISVVAAAIVADTPNQSGGLNPPKFVGALTYRVNLATAQTFTSFQILGSSAGTRFEDNSSVANTYQAFYTKALSGADLGLSTYDGLAENSTGLFSSRGALSLRFNNVTAAQVLEWSSATLTSLAGTIFNSPLATNYISFLSSIPDGSSLDLTGISITNPATGTAFLTDVPANEILTLQVSASSGFSLSDVTNNGAGTVVVSAPSVTFAAPNLTNAEFNNIRCRVSLVPGGAVTLNDNGSIATGRDSFEPSAVDLANNHITLTGIAGKLNNNSVIRVYGTDVPAPLDVRAVYYPSTDYDGSNNLKLAASPGGVTIDLTDQGSNPVPDNGFGMGISPWTELDIQLITSGAYTFDLTAAATSAGVTLATNDILVFQAIHHDTPGTGGSAAISHYAEEVFSYQGVSIKSLRSLSENSQAMALLSEIGADGSQVTGYVFDADTPGKVQIDASKTTIDTRELVAYYYYVQWLEAGIRKIRGNVEINNLNSIAIRGAFTIQALAKSTISGPYIERLDGKSFIADESAQITPFFEDTRAAIVEKEVAINLPDEFAVAIQSIWAIAAQLLNKSGGGSGSGASAADIYNYFATGVRPDIFKANVSGLSTHGPADVWTQPTRSLTDKVGFGLSTMERSTLATQIEAALLNEGDGQQLIDAILQVINSNLDLPALELAAISTQVRTELSPELGRLDVAVSSRLANADYTAPLSSAGIQSALTLYGAATSTDVGNVITHGDVNWSTATGFSTHGPADIWTQATRSLTNVVFPSNFDGLINQISIDTAAVARGRFKVNATGTGTQYRFDGDPLQAFNFLNADGELANPLEEQIFERVPV
ncbi:hypothetical protein [Leptothoe spongobia]|uniref:Uncharacterized protein n=1 Tax=Leptothoe spongobia TAU-MAC 1115 TaxID=1967444 RepID=A0A947DGR3_9CYAN|nr:hypothetical protein [Leptothoe spongobia]MBT9316278.1 hypothetical protein [Leptothoe spongobia TAU-MAC 1115]